MNPSREEYNYQLNKINEEDGYESNDDIELEVINSKTGDTQIFSVPFRPTHCNEKRLICFSILNNETCGYGSNCTYAHSIDEQIIDLDKRFIYQIVLDKNLMNFFSLTNPKTDEIYKNLLFISHICENCSNKKCTGGYNCRNGVSNSSLKICKNDLLTGECLNKVINLNIDRSVLKKIKGSVGRKSDVKCFELCDEYKGCINGHHLTQRKLLPYYKYLHKRENSKKNKYQSIRYLDLDPIYRIFKNSTDKLYHKYDDYSISHDSDSESTDEETNNWFRKDNNSVELDESIDNNERYNL